MSVFLCLSVDGLKCFTDIEAKQITTCRETEGYRTCFTKYNDSKYCTLIWWDRSQRESRACVRANAKVLFISGATKKKYVVRTCTYVYRLYQHGSTSLSINSCQLIDLAKWRREKEVVWNKMKAKGCSLVQRLKGGLCFGFAVFPLSFLSYYCTHGAEWMCNGDMQNSNPTCRWRLNITAIRPQKNRSLCLR